MSAANANEPVRKATSVVRVDPRTGHLVRTVVVSPRVVVPKSIPSADPQPAAASSTVSDKASIAAIVEATAKAHELDPALVHSIIQVESNYNQYAISNKGAEGLMQLVPATARRLGVTNSFDPQQNIDAGVRYYKYLRTMFGDDRLALAAYNAGEGAVAKYKFQVPPYRETMDYVYKVGKRWGEASRKRKQEPAKPAVTAAAAPVEPPAPTHPKLELSQDEQGRVFLRTARQ